MFQKRPTDFPVGTIPLSFIFRGRKELQGSQLLQPNINHNNFCSKLIKMGIFRQLTDYFDYFSVYKNIGCGYSLEVSLHLMSNHTLCFMEN